MIEIDGSVGGGQLLRSALSLSAVTKKLFKMVNIRGKRNNPGLQLQHLTAVNAMKEICNAEVKGNELHSKELEFIPRKVEGGIFELDIGTAGSTTLVMQTLLPVLLFAEKESEVEIRGGTANPLAPPALEIKEVFLYFLKKFGIEVEFEILKEGFYPKGGGLIKFRVNHVSEVKKCDFLERGKEVKREVFAVASKELEKVDVGERMIAGFKEEFGRGENLSAKIRHGETLSAGCYLHANVEFEKTKISFTVLGEKGKKAEDVGKECALQLKKVLESDATVDPFTADQLLLYLALSNGGSFITSEITDHMKTNIDLIEKFLPVKFEVEGLKVVCLPVA